MFLNCSTCFGRHTAHHQELKTVIAASGFTYVFGCRPQWWLSHRRGQKPKTYVKPEAAITVFELLMMGGVSPETCWAIKKHWNNKFYYTVASWWFFLWILYYDAQIHEHQVVILYAQPLIWFYRSLPSTNILYTILILSSTLHVLPISLFTHHTSVDNYYVLRSLEVFR